MIIGREKSTQSLEKSRMWLDWFWSREDVVSFLQGDTDSSFIAQTLPVDVLKECENFRFKFYANLFENFRVHDPNEN